MKIVVNNAIIIHAKLGHAQYANSDMVYKYIPIKANTVRSV
jgi:hypothetical protein